MSELHNVLIQADKQATIREALVDATGIDGDTADMVAVAMINALYAIVKSRCENETVNP